VLERRTTAQDDASDAALVIAEDGSAAAVMRADRTPPEPVAHVSDIDGLGAASSIGDAEAEAAAAAHDAFLRRQERTANVLAARGKSFEDELRRELIELIREAVQSEVAGSKQQGKTIGPALAWQELRRDKVHGFGYVDQFAARLNVDANTAVPKEADGANVTLTRQAAGERLFKLIDRWKARVGSDS
jgi:hypothetical protein